MAEQHIYSLWEIGKRSILREVMYAIWFKTPGMCSTLDAEVIKVMEVDPYESNYVPFSGPCSPNPLCVTRRLPLQTIWFSPALYGSFTL